MVYYVCTKNKTRTFVKSFSLSVVHGSNHASKFQSISAKEIQSVLQERVIIMEAYVVDYSMNTIFSKLDEAIDDLENGRTLSEEEIWEELDDI